MADGPKKFVNRYGRKTTRGLRPWLLLPKILCYSVMLGGIATGVVLCMVQVARGMPTPMGDGKWVAAQAYLSLSSQLDAIALWVVMPTAAAAFVLGVALMFDAPAVFLRLRWLQIKTALVLVTLPVMVVVGRLLLAELRHGLAREVQYFDANLPDGEILPMPVVDGSVAAGFQANIFLLGLTGLIGFVLLSAVVVIGRHKPRFRQNWAKAYPKKSGK